MTRINGKFTTVTVRASWAAQTVDGSTALVLDTEEVGAIAFVVDAQAIAAIRGDLGQCELALSRKPGQA